MSLVIVKNGRQQWVVLRKNSSATRKTQKWHDLNGIEDTAAEHAFAVPI